MNDNETIIRVEEMTARYGDALVLDALSFEVKRGEIFVILGGSGCGKSTLLKHIPLTGHHLWKEQHLEQHLVQLEEAKKRDHRKLGRELKLFHIDEDVGQGPLLAGGLGGDGRTQPVE